MSAKKKTSTATPSQIAKSSILYVQELGDFIAGKSYYTRRANLPSYLIKYCISGEGLLDYEGSCYTIKPGQLFWIDCEKPQYYRTSPEKGNWRILWVHYYGQTARAYYELFLAQNGGSALTCSSAARCCWHWPAATAGCG